MFNRKKSLGSSRRDLRQLLDFDGREDAMDWWLSAESLMKDAALSGPATFIAMTLAMALAGEEAIKAAAGLHIVIRAGYALRATLPRITSRVGRLDADSLDRQGIIDLAERPVDGQLGLLWPDDQVQGAAVLGPSIELLREYADERFGQIVSVDPNFWTGTVAVATYQLHKNVERLPDGLIDALLRYGFAVRAWEEAVGIANDGSQITTDAERQGSSTVAERQSDGARLDIDAWLKDAATVCTNPFEDFAELMLEISTIELLGIQRVVERYTGTPWRGHDLAVEAGVANARLGYALRNRETQLIECYGRTGADDPLAELAAERAENHGIKTAVIHRLIRDALDYGDAARLYRATPGTSTEVRRGAFEHWAKQHFPGQDPRHGEGITATLMEHGYFLHRLFEIRPELLTS